MLLLLPLRATADRPSRDKDRRDLIANFCLFFADNAVSAAKFRNFDFCTLIAQQGRLDGLRRLRLRHHDLLRVSNDPPYVSVPPVSVPYQMGVAE
jgi:hypothetical protein